VIEVLAILPAKGFADAKSRLADELTEGARRALAEAMFTDVVTALRRSEAISATLVVSSDLHAQQIAGSHGAMVLEDRRDAGQSAAAEQGIARARELDARRVLLVPGDCALLDPVELDDLVGREHSPITIVPDRHGTGTNALLLAPPPVIVPGFGPGSFERHRARAREAGVEPAVAQVPSLALDVDTPDDLGALLDALPDRPGRAPCTRALLERLARAAA
jgi:2-phospho-L-lactate guanylyltransferase